LILPSCPQPQPNLEPHHSADALQWGTRPGLMFVAMFLLAALQGCAQLGSRTALPLQQELPAQWQNTGKIAINIPAADTATAGSNHILRYVWQQNGEDYSVRLTGAFGLGAVTVERRGEQVLLLRGDRVIEQASSSEQLFYRHTGLLLPVSLLRYWITGVPDAAVKQAHKPGEQAATVLASFERSGWRVSFPKTMVQQGITLPRKIIAKGREAAVTVAIARWQLGQP